MELHTIALIVVHLIAKCSTSIVFRNPGVQDSMPRQMSDTDYLANVVRHDIGILNSNIENLFSSHNPSICNDIQTQMTFHTDSLKLLNMRVTKLIRFVVKDEKFEETCPPEFTTNANTSQNETTVSSKKLLRVHRRFKNGDSQETPDEKLSPNVINTTDNIKESLDGEVLVKPEMNRNIETTTNVQPQDAFGLIQNLLNAPNECKYK